MVETWEAFFLGELGAAAGLLGLLFVAVSINLSKIIESGGLTDRALVALVLLLQILVDSSMMLIPNQMPLAIGLEIIGVSAIAGIFGTFVGVHAIRLAKTRARTIHESWSLVLFAIAVAPCLIGGAIVLGGDTNGLYWLAAGICFSFVKAVSDAWVFLVEINR